MRSSVRQVPKNHFRLFKKGGIYPKRSLEFRFMNFFHTILMVIRGLVDFISRVHFLTGLKGSTISIYIYLFIHIHTVSSGLAFLRGNQRYTFGVVEAKVPESMVFAYEILGKNDDIKDFLMEIHHQKKRMCTD